VGRIFRDLQGLANQRVAATADRVLMMVAGIPIQIKPAYTQTFSEDSNHVF